MAECPREPAQREFRNWICSACFVECLDHQLVSLQLRGRERFAEGVVDSRASNLEAFPTFTEYLALVVQLEQSQRLGGGFGVAALVPVCRGARYAAPVHDLFNGRE